MTAESFLDGKVILHPGDCLDVLKTLEENSVDSVVTDPPYHLTSIVKRFGAENAAPAKSGKTGAYKRASAGFMGKVWDGGEIAFEPETWAAVMRVLKPGGHLLAFGAPKNFGFMQYAIAQAGFEVRDVLCWLFGSGFPKSHDVSKGIDKRPGVARHAEFAADLRAAMAANGFTNTFDVAEKVVGRRTGAVANWQKYQFPEAKWWPALRDLLGMDATKWDAVIAEAERAKLGERKSGDPVAWYGETERGDGMVDITAATTDAARQWSGWGTALKPAHEPVIIAQKPLTAELFFAILIVGITDNFSECVRWCDLSVADAEKSFSDIQATLSAVGVHSVQESARTFALASIEPASFVVPGSISIALGSSGPTETKVDIARLLARPLTNQELAQGQTTPSGEVDDISTRIMGMCTSVITDGMSESIASSWLNISAELLSRANKFTIETASRLTIALRTLNCLLRPNIGDATGVLSPNYQPIILARKPLSESTVAANCLKWGVSALNIDGCRVEAPDGITTGGAQGHMPQPEDWGSESRIIRSEPHTNGRWPANVIHDGSDEVVGVFPDAPGQQRAVGSANGAKPSINTYGDYGPRDQFEPRNDSGSAARFFYSAKADSDDRLGSKHPTVKPVDLIQYLVRLVTPPNGLVLDCFAGTGTTAEAAWREGFRAILIERETEYCNDIRRRMALCLAGPAERKRESNKARHGDKPFEAGSLFA